MLSLLIFLPFSYCFDCVGFDGSLFIMEQSNENENLKMNAKIEIFENEVLNGR
jgi:hypothetical protein